MNDILIFGGLMMDKYYLIDSFPLRGQDGVIMETFDYIGGCAINMAFTIKNLGGIPYVISYVGTDEIGQTCIEYLRSNEMPEDCVRQIEGDTGYCMVFVEPDGERTFLTKEGCGGKFDVCLLNEKSISKSKVAVVTGYYLVGEGGRTVIAALEALKLKGYSILFDPSPMVGYLYTEVLDKMIELSDIITPNLEEGKYLAKGKETENWAREMAERGHAIVLTKGVLGGTIFNKEGESSFISIPVTTVDTTGAGDSFAGALAFGMSQEWELKKSVDVAVRCASITAGICGPHGVFDTSWVGDLQGTWGKDAVQEGILGGRNERTT